jgi:hypothetical protein
MCGSARPRTTARSTSRAGCSRAIARSSTRRPSRRSRARPARSRGRGAPSSAPSAIRACSRRRPTRRARAARWRRSSSASRSSPATPRPGRGGPAEGMRRVLSGTERMATAIETLLLSARNASGTAGSCDPFVPVRDVVASLRVAARAHDVELALVGAPGLATARADAGLVAQAVNPLIDNAIHHAARRVEVGVGALDGEVRIAVRGSRATLRRPGARSRRASRRSGRRPARGSPRGTARSCRSCRARARRSDAAVTCSHRSRRRAVG